MLNCFNLNEYYNNFDMNKAMLLAELEWRCYL